MAQQTIQATGEIYKIIVAASSIIVFLGGAFFYLLVNLFKTFTRDIGENKKDIDKLFDIIGERDKQCGLRGERIASLEAKNETKSQ